MKGNTAVRRMPVLLSVAAVALLGLAADGVGPVGGAGGDARVGLHQRAIIALMSRMARQAPSGVPVIFDRP